jgi:hypothetical protein
MIGKMLPWLQERIKHWTNPAHTAFDSRTAFRYHLQQFWSGDIKHNVAPTTARANFAIAGSLKNS